MTFILLILPILFYSLIEDVFNGVISIANDSIQIHQAVLVLVLIPAIFGMLLNIAIYTARKQKNEIK